MEKERLRFMVTVCESYYHEGLNQVEIAKKYGISRPQVSRIISAAKDEGIVEIKVRNPFSNEMALEKELLKRFGLKDVVVVDVTEADHESSHVSFAKAGSTYFESVIKKGGTVGVMAGRSIASVVNELNEMQQRDMHFVPLIGGWGLKDASWHANTSVTALARKTQGDYWVLHAPAIVSSMETHINLVNEPEIKRVIDLLNHVDIALVGVGEMSEGSTFSKSLSMKKDELLEIKKEGAVCSIGTSFINKEGEAVGLDFSKRMIGIEEDYLKEVPLVIGLARGASKVEAIHASLKGKWLDVLITDLETAESIFEKDILEGDIT